MSSMSVEFNQKCVSVEGGRAGQGCGLYPVVQFEGPLVQISYVIVDMRVHVLSYCN